ncbi:MAG: class F sortase [Thermomicrobiales bacterium]
MEGANPTQWQQSGLFVFKLSSFKKVAATVLVVFMLAIMIEPTLHTVAAPVHPRGQIEQQVLRPDQWMGVFDERLLAGQLKGVRPTNIKIDAIGVDANIEMLEVVNGEMQPPSNESDVAWYKDSGRLGAPGNVMMAGHLNWYGVPVAVFGYLDQLKKNDTIEVTGADGKVFVYQVKWVKNFPADEAPPKLVVGGSSKKVLTLITCGGYWQPDQLEYNQRTVVRAELVEDEM